MHEDCNSSGEASRTDLAKQQEDTTLVMIPALVYLCLLSVTGIIGNTLVLVVYPLRFSWSPIRSFIMAAAFYDLLTNTIVIPGDIYQIFHSWDFEDSRLCKARIYFNATTTIASALQLLAIAVTRYRKICHPFGWQVTMHHTKLIHAAVLFLALLFSVPCAITYGIQNRKIKNSKFCGHSCLVDEILLPTPWPSVTSGFYVVLFLSACVPLVVLYLLIGSTAKMHTTTGRVGRTDHQPDTTNYNNVTTIATTNFTEDVSMSLTSDPCLFTEHDKTVNISSEASTEGTAEEPQPEKANQARVSLRKRLLLKFQSKKTQAEPTELVLYKNTAYNYDDLALCCRHSLQRESTTSFSEYDKDARTSVVQERPVNGTELSLRGDHTLSIIKSKIRDEISRSETDDPPIRPRDPPFRPHDPPFRSRDATDISSKWSCGQCESEINGGTNVGSDTNTEICMTPPVVICLNGAKGNSTERSVTKTATIPKSPVRETRFIPDTGNFKAKLISNQPPDPAHKPAASGEDNITSPVTIVLLNSPTPAEGNSERHHQKGPRRPKRVGRTSCMLLAMSVTFIGGFVPFLVLQFFRSSVDQQVRAEYLALYNLFLRSYLLNSAVNPIIYNLCHVKFRRECFKLLTRSRK